MESQERGEVLTRPEVRHAQQPPPWWRRLKWKDARDILLFSGGMAGVFHETVVSQTERPTLLLMFAAMMGLPAFLRADEKKEERAEYQYERTEARADRQEDRSDRQEARQNGQEGSA